MTLCDNCKHAYDLHDNGGICAYPDCRCTEFKPMRAIKEADKGLGSWLNKHFGGKKSQREKLESH